MIAQELDYVRDTIETEGFDYAFNHYSSFETIDDPEFHRLRKAYIDAYDALYAYLNMDEYYNNH